MLTSSRTPGLSETLLTKAGRTCVLPWLLCACIGSSTAVASEASACESAAWINASVARIATTKDAVEQMEYANGLWVRVSRLSESELDAVPAESIDLVAQLLRDDNDLVKAVAAHVLGSLGHRAERALPALERASAVPDKPIPDDQFVSGAPLSDVMLQTIESIKDELRDRPSSKP
jgi:hypothetical protein